MNRWLDGLVPSRLKRILVACRERWARCRQLRWLPRGCLGPRL